ncbi:SAM-dependent methyltransferase [Actinomadura latina]|uniref:SAM-dependent methyltransferase n=1 Tax=Actinomadura latina TaxID=163603 RepID=A0A846YPJ2_9ACTN|nr:SAM-dependent methyltransferase [Actinomadura latina]NKZ02680.1 SAM-dependent methyltransferase [Actinomadura latina]
MASEIVPADIDVTIPNVARIYDYFLGGKDNYAADRAAAEQIIGAAPATRATALASRHFLARVVRFLAVEAGIDQFLDIGCGLPTQQNVHEVAQEARSDASVVYVDNDSVVLAHARALLATRTRTEVIGGDVCDPESILADPDLTAILDLDRPVGVLLFSVLHCVSDDDLVRDAVRRLRDALAPGSHVAISHITRPPAASSYRAAAEEAARTYRDRGVNTGMTFRDREQIAGFFDGMELLEPGLVGLPDWRPDPELGPVSGQGLPAVYLCGVGRKAAR